MFNRRRFEITFSCTLTGLALATTCLAQVNQPSFHGLGDLPGGTVGSKAWGVSGNGMVVVGDAQSAAGTEACRWLRQTDGTWLVEVIGDFPGGGTQGSARGASFDGNIIAGNGSTTPGPEGFRWTASTGLQHLGDLPGGSFHSHAYDISTDGSTIVGTSIGPTFGFFPVFWPSGASAPTALPGALGGHVLAVSGDGSIVVGNGHFQDKQGASLTHGVIWSGGGMSIVAADQSPDSPPDCAATAISDNGAIVVGNSNGDVFITGTSGTTLIGPGFANDVSNNGTRVVGHRNTASGPQAFIWEPVGGMRDLKQFLINDVGLNLTGWTLSLAYGISNDGNTIVGHGVNPSGQAEGWVAYAPTDADGDGLLDRWETQGQGIDINGDRVIDLDLFALGARPDHKDLFVEIDCMTGRNPADLGPVVAAFNAAPVPNPDGVSGVRLHLQIDDTDLPLGGDWPVWPSQFDNLKPLYFGTAIERNDPNSIAILEAKRRAFRYCIYADTSLNAVAGGVARDYHANDFVVFKAYYTSSSQAEQATFMHELGHCLDLRHGGNDDNALKPNYISVMSYLRLIIPPGDTWRLDFSRGTMLPVIDDNIDESIMLQPLSPSDPNVGMLTYYAFTQCEPSPCDPAQTPGVAVGYDIGSGPRDFNGDLQITSGVCMDLTYYGPTFPIAAGQTASPCDIMNDHNDWANLRYALVDEGSPLAGGPPTNPPVEPTIAQLEALAAFLPPPPCRPDINDSGTVDADDLVAVILSWGPCPLPPAMCTADIAPMPVNGLVDSDDLVAVILSWGDCP